MNKRLRKSITTLLSGSALALASSAASAITVTDLGTLPNAGLFTNSMVPQYAWDGWNGITTNLGWAHNSKWYTFTLAARTTIQITMTSTEVGMKPAFSIWKTTGSFIGTNHLAHEYNQVNLNLSSSFLKPQFAGGDGVTAIIGYVNSGNNFTNGDGQRIWGGTAGMTRVAAGYAAFARTFEAGQYLIVAGGSCNDQTCGSPAPKAFKLNVQKLPLPNSGKSP